MKRSKRAWALSALSLLLLTSGIYVYQVLQGPALRISHNVYILLDKDDNQDSIVMKLKPHGLKHIRLFPVFAKRMNLNRWVKKGRYELKPDQTLTEVIRVFREGRMRSADMVIRPMISLEKLAGICGRKLEPDSTDFIKIFKDPVILSTFGLTVENIYTILLPDTYNFLWHTDPEEFLQRMIRESGIFWNKNRQAKLSRSGLSSGEVMILASIVSKETNKYDEMPVIAGMYINRLRKGMLLQADPTVKFALNDPSLRRIYEGHLQTPSPYNTYLHAGLPPGPICIPSKQSVDAVLDFEEHEYLFMCAREDFSGYHVFAVNYAAHLKNAARYRKALDEQGIE